MKFTCTATRQMVIAFLFIGTMIPNGTLADRPPKTMVHSGCGPNRAFSNSELEIEFEIRESSDNYADDIVYFSYKNKSADRRIVQFDVIGRDSHGELIKASMGGPVNGRGKILFGQEHSHVRIRAARDAYPLVFRLRNVKSCPSSVPRQGRYGSPCARVASRQSTTITVTNRCEKETKEDSKETGNKEVRLSDICGARLGDSSGNRRHATCYIGTTSSSEGLGADFLACSWIVEDGDEHDSATEPFRKCYGVSKADSDREALIDCCRRIANSCVLDKNTFATNDDCTR